MGGPIPIRRRLGREEEPQRAPWWKAVSGRRPARPKIEDQQQQPGPLGKEWAVEKPWGVGKQPGPFVEEKVLEKLPPLPKLSGHS
jgi:hypothetical protein